MYFFDLMQTLTTLYLIWNEIRDEGTQCLVNALKHNTVRFVLNLFNSCIFIEFNADHYYVRS